MRLPAVNQRSPRIYVSAVLFCSALLFLTGVIRGQSQLNLVYVESNIGSTDNMNSVFGWSNDGSGNLTALPGSPYSTSGTGFYDPNGTTESLGSENQIVIRKDGDLLFAVNAHTNTIAVFSINSDGSLTQITGSPFASNGQEPLSLALSDDILTGDTDFLAVLNKANDPNQTGGTPNVTTFKVDSTGTPTPVTNSTITFAGLFPSQVFNAGTSVRFLYVGFLAPTSTINAYRYKLPGTLSFENSVAAPTGGQFFGQVAHPTKRFIYAGLPGSSQVGIYNYKLVTGIISQTGTVPNAGSAVCWLATNAEGTRLYTAEFNSGTISTYDIGTKPSVPAQLQNFKLTGTKPTRPTNLRLDPTEKFLYVVDGTNLHVLNVAADGTLSETVTPIALAVPTGEFPLGIATVLR